MSQAVRYLWTAALAGAVVGVWYGAGYIVANRAGWSPWGTVFGQSVLYLLVFAVVTFSRWLAVRRAR